MNRSAAAFVVCALQLGLGADESAADIVIVSGGKRVGVTISQVSERTIHIEVASR